MPEESGSSTQTEAVPRCVLLVGESSAVPSSLVGALDRRGMEIVIVRHAPEVMVELAPAGSVPSENTSARSSVAGSGSGPGSGARRHASSARHHDSTGTRSSSPPTGEAPAAPSLSIVVVEPQQQPRIGELREAVAAYYPAVRCWQYHARGPEGHASLEALEPAVSSASAGQDFVDASDSKPHTLEEQETPPPAGETARVKGANQRLRSLVVQVDDPRPSNDGPLVSEEELAMLLGPDPEPAGPAPGTSPDTGATGPAGPSGSLGISPDSRHPDGERE
ncbi:MAG: hypothetical protein AAF911_09800 [Planctomycetota bacterium]